MPSNICSTDADEAANALGKWGVDLTNEDADLAVEGTVPNTIKINARDAKKTPRLANSAVVRTRKTFEFKTCHVYFVSDQRFKAWIICSRIWIELQN